jgi:mannose-6-phosphate isomerase-like protein (cupin superfamily)
MPGGHTVGSSAPARSSALGRRPRWDSRRRTDEPAPPTPEAPPAPAGLAPAKVNLAEKFSRFSAHWAPKVVGELNGQQVRLAKLLGPFVWHHHEHEDELFLVVKGRLRVEFRERTVELEEGELLIVPRGVEHRPVAEEEVHVLLFEPASTLNTGNTREERTAEHLERL